MKIKAALHPAMEALTKDIQGLRTIPSHHNTNVKERIELLLGQLPRFPGHYLHIFNFSEGRVVYARGIEEVLGYPDEDFDLDLLFRIIHPEDASIVARLSECALEAMSKLCNPDSLQDLCLSLDYRLRKADGRYIRVLDQTSVFELDGATGTVHSAFSLCKDISGIKTSNTIGWQAHGFEFFNFQVPEGKAGQVVYRPTRRELEVLRKIAEGKGSRKIADELCISPLTVVTHRRNLLHRTGLKNVAQLIRHASALGWV